MSRKIKDIKDKNTGELVYPRTHVSAVVLSSDSTLEDLVEVKQDKIDDLDEIRAGAAKGATALQSVPSEYVTETELSNKGYATISALNNKVDAINGKQLSTEDFTTALKTKLEGLNNYDDTELSNAVETLRGDFDNIVSGDTTTAIKTFNEVIAFLDGITDTQDLESIIASIEQQIAGKMDKVTLATVATSGSYNDLSNKPTIPSAVTESTVSGWGFTKNTGTYSKPSGGIPNTDLSSAVQTSLGKADTAIQSTSFGELTDLAVVKGFESAQRGTIYTLPDEVNGDEDDILLSRNSVKTINGESILGSGNISISGGGGSSMQNKICMLEINDYIITVGDTGVFQISPDELYDMISNNYAFFIRLKQDYDVQIVPCCINKNGRITMSETPGYFTTLNYKNTINSNTITWECIEKINLDEEKQDALVSGVNIKTINGLSILGGGNITIDSGEGGAGVYITPFTVEQFCVGWIELTDEQRNGILNAASQNRIIGMPYGSYNETGYVVADYRYSLSNYDNGYWSLTLGVIYEGAHYSNSIYSNANPNFTATRITITPFKPKPYFVTMEDGVATVSDDYNYTDNCIFWVEGECTELYIYLEPSEIGKTVRFFTGESCTLEIGYPAYWANGEVPTIEPYTHYELSLVVNMEGVFNAVLTPFKLVE